MSCAVGQCFDYDGLRVMRPRRRPPILGLVNPLKLVVQQVKQILQTGCNLLPDVSTASVGGDIGLVGGQLGLAANGVSGELSLTRTASVTAGVPNLDAYVSLGVVEVAPTNRDLNTPANVPDVSVFGGFGRTGATGSADNSGSTFALTFGPSLLPVSGGVQLSSTRTVATVPYLGYALNAAKGICTAVYGK
jgi:hypothetical protein